jgi:hypothetical protein
MDDSVPQEDFRRVVDAMVARELDPYSAATELMNLAFGAPEAAQPSRSPRR